MAISRQQTSRRQQTFSFSTWGGKRKNAGRKPQGARAGVPHRPRPALASRHPVHVTLRVVAGLPNLRSKACIRTIEQVFVRTSQRPGFRLVHYSVQRNHLHLLCEAKNAASLSSGLRGLSISLARRLNRVLGRKGALLADRYHSRILRTPREVRAVLAYLLGNARRHAWQRRQSFERRWLDPCSSARYFDGWRKIAGSRDTAGSHNLKAWPVLDASPVAPPGTWLVQTGWRRLGLLAPNAVPGPQAKTAPGYCPAWHK